MFHVAGVSRHPHRHRPDRYRSTRRLGRSLGNRRSSSRSDENHNHGRTISCARILDRKHGEHPRERRLTAEFKGVLEMEISLVKSIAIQHQPAEYRIELAKDWLNAPPQPRHPGISPSCAYVKHIDVPFTCACNEFWQTTGARGHSIPKGEPHGSAFKGKAPIL